MGFVLLAIGIAMVFLGHGRRDGTRMLPMSDTVAMAFYPVICLGFITFGLALIIAG